MYLKVLGLLSFALISGCATLSTDNISTKGLALCTVNEICPLVTVTWNDQKKDTFNVKVSLNSTYDYYEVQKVSFSNDEKSYDFDTESKTIQDMVLNLKNSKNTIIVPKNLMIDLKSNAISMNIYTDKGVISRYIYKDGVESSIYKQFSSVYNQ